MDRETLRALARCRRLLLCELHALPPGTLPPELEDAIEDVIAPGFRERVLARYVEGLPPAGAVQ
jgi:hypothetical protein